MKYFAHSLGFFGALLFWAGPADAFWLNWSGTGPAASLSLLGAGAVVAAALLLHLSRRGPAVRPAG